MTGDFVPFASRTYGLLFLLLLIARGMDFLSTWVATPNLVLEGNPIAKRLGWKWGLALHFLLCVGLAFWPLPAIVISTASVLVAARNFQAAWLMRSLGEHLYREWHVERVQETSVTEPDCAEGWSEIIVSLLEGKLVRGYTRAFHPARPNLVASFPPHVQLRLGDGSDHRVVVQLTEECFCFHGLPTTSCTAASETSSAS